MQFRILGPIEAIGGDGRPLRCTGQPLRLLALLLLDRRVVPADVAIDALWRDALAGPSRQRAAGGRVAPAPETRRGSDRLAGERLQPAARRPRLDRRAALRAARRRGAGCAVARGEQETASRVFADALDLWRGPALQDVRYEPFALAEAERLEELRLAVPRRPVSTQTSRSAGTRRWSASCRHWSRSIRCASRCARS